MAADDKKASAGSNPNNNEPEALTRAEDTSKPGWPQLSENPFVDHSYYERFDPAVRPKQVPGGVTSSLVTPQQLEMIRAQGLTFKLVTAINFSMRTHIVTIPGGAIGTAQQLELPPLGVYRAPEDWIPLRQAVEGSKWAMFHLAAPQGNCDGNRKIKSPMQGTNQIVEYESCDKIGCKRHPVPSGLLFGHSILEAQRLISSIGDPLIQEYVDAENKPQKHVSFMQPFIYSSQKLLQIVKIDPRMPVVIGVNARIAALNAWEQNADRVTRQGGQVAGR